MLEPNGFYLTYRPKEPITDHFGPIIGDCVNNLREAMDYWINAALTATGKPRKAHLPFSEKWKALKSPLISPR